MNRDDQNVDDEEDRGSDLNTLHPVSPHVGMRFDPSIAWGNDEDDYEDYGNFPVEDSAIINNSTRDQKKKPDFFLTEQPPKSSNVLPTISSPLKIPKTPRSMKHKSSSVYAASNTSSMQRTNSKFDLGAMQLSGMGLTHSASTLNFLQNALDDELSAAELNRVPSWVTLAAAAGSGNRSRSGSGIGPNNQLLQLNESSSVNSSATSATTTASSSSSSSATITSAAAPVPAKSSSIVTTATTATTTTTATTATTTSLISPPGSPLRNGAMLPKIRLGAILKPLRNGADSIVDDSFWKCFEDPDDVGWNWNFYLFPIWCIGVLTRYIILFPIRLLFLILGVLIFFIGFLCIRLWYFIGCSCRCCGHANHLSVEAGLVRLFALSFVVSWTGVVRYHGIRPSDTMKKRVFVANHSSMIDVTMLLQRDNYSLVGQAHKGWLRFIQRVMLASLQCVWFDRGETKDRNIVFEKIQKHAKNENGDLPVRKICVFFVFVFCFCFC